jgi:hypothetical protein
MNASQASHIRSRCCALKRMLAGRSLDRLEPIGIPRRGPGDRSPIHHRPRFAPARISFAAASACSIMSGRF